MLGPLKGKTKGTAIFVFKKTVSLCRQNQHRFEVSNSCCWFVLNCRERLKRSGISRRLLGHLESSRVSAWVRCKMIQVIQAQYFRQMECPSMFFSFLFQCFWKSLGFSSKHLQEPRQSMESFLQLGPVSEPNSHEFIHDIKLKYDFIWVHVWNRMSSYDILGDISSSFQDVRSEDGILKLGPQATDALFLTDGYFVLKFWSFSQICRKALLRSFDMLHVFTCFFHVFYQHVHFSTGWKLWRVDIFWKAALYSCVCQAWPRQNVLDGSISMALRPFDLLKFSMCLLQFGRFDCSQLVSLKVVFHVFTWIRLLTVAWPLQHWMTTWHICHGVMAEILGLASQTLKDGHRTRPLF